MKRIFLLCIACMVLLCGCSGFAKTEKANEKQEKISMFVEVEKTMNWKVVYHKETKVMYAVSDGGYGTFTLLVNADGTPMLYKGGEG